MCVCVCGGLPWLRTPSSSSTCHMPTAWTRECTQELCCICQSTSSVPTQHCLWPHTHTQRERYTDNTAYTYTHTQNTYANTDTHTLWTQPYTCTPTKYYASFIHYEEMKWMCTCKNVGQRDGYIYNIYAPGNRIWALSYIWSIWQRRKAFLYLYGTCINKMHITYLHSRPVTSGEGWCLWPLTLCLCHWLTCMFSDGTSCL